MWIGLLGAVVAREGGTDRPVGGLRLRGLLARLALDVGRPVGVATLVDDLWGDTPPEAAANAVQALVSRLRRVLGGEVVATDPAGYRLRLDPDEVDAARFARLVGAARTDPARARPLLAEALGLWRGPALDDVRDLPFADAAAQRLAELRAGAVEDCARLALAAGEPDAVLDALTRQLDAAPLRETTAALLARSLHAAGRQADALAVLDRTRGLLADELGLDPGPELAATRLDVLRGAPAPARPAPGPGGVRTGLSSFVGRDADLRQVRDLLGRARLVSLIGPGGAGKTRLARETAAGFGERAETRLVELAPLADPALLPATVLAAVGGPELRLRTQDRRPAEDGASDTTARLLTALAGRELVLVMDNCEHLVGAAAALAETLLTSSPQLRILATSREQLGVPGELLHPVEALAADDAVRLFVERAVAVRPDFAPTPEVTAVIAEICDRLDGQPLPIELAAARLRTLSPAEIASRLDDRFRLLTGGPRTALPRHQTLRAVVDWSWDLLAEPERALARRLSAFAGGATAEAVGRVCGVDDTLELLTALVDKSLVVAVPQQGPTRYRMLETIREYAAQALDAAGERHATHGAHAEYYLELAEAAEPHLRRAEQLDWLARLRDEQGNLDAALRRAVAVADAATAHRLVAALGWSWLIRGVFEEAADRVRQVAALDGPAPAAARALNLAFLALIDIGRGQPPELAEQHLTDALSAIDEVPGPRHPVLTLAGPILTLFALEDDGPVARLAEQRDGDPWIRGFAFQLLGQIAENNGDLDAQRRYCRTAHDLFAAIGERFGLGMTLHSLGELEDTAGNLDAAQQAYGEAVELARELSNQDDLPQLLIRESRLLIRRGDLAGGRAQLLAALSRDRQSFESANMLRLALADADRLAGNLDQARAHLAEAASTVELGGLGVPQRRAIHAATAAAVELDADDLAAAAELLAAAGAEAADSKDGPIVARACEVGARLALARGEPVAAAELLGIAIAQRGSLDHGDAEVLATLAAVHTALGPAAAEEAVRRGRELPRADGPRRLIDYARRR